MRPQARLRAQAKDRVLQRRTTLKDEEPDKHGRLGRVRDHIGARRGTNIGKVAAARELIELVFYGLRDGEIRCLNHRSA
jgi:hypothetical protein